MGRRGMNLESVKIKNREAILKLLNNNGAMSRKDIALSVNLTSAAVTQLFSEMIEEGIIVEKGEVVEEGKVGRKKILVDIEYDCRIICSITIEKYMTWITLANLRGEVVQTVTIGTQHNIAPNLYLTEIIKECKKMLDDHQIPVQKLLGIGVSLRGIVDKEQGISHKAYDIWDEEVNVKEIIKNQIDTHVIVENNMKAFAQGEIIFGLGKQYEKLLFLKWYPGVGSAIVIDGKVYHSDSNNVPELGHCLVEEDGLMCKCGKKGCLETKASMAAIIRKINPIFSQEKTPLLFSQTQGDGDKIHQVLLKNITSGAADIDESVLQIILKASKNMAKIIANAVTMLAPDKVVIYGDLFKHDRIRNGFLNSCKLYEIQDVDNFILKSEISNQFFYIGGTALVMNELFFNSGGYRVIK